MMTIGDRIKQLRRKNSLTQDDQAETLSTTKQTIHTYENNIITNIPADKIESLALALGTTPSYLMGWDDAAYTIAAHHDDEEWSDEELAEIEEFKKYVLSKRKDQ